MTPEPEPQRDEGLIASLHRLGLSLLRVLATRIEILSTEVAEERFNLAKLAIVVLTVLFCLQVGLIFALLFVVLAVSPDHRLAAIGIGALVMLLGALIGALWLRQWLKTRRPMFATTIAELRKDRERLPGGS
ncbi:MAG: phage holin family protein [Candidatus Eiseniibacteriota bacterium]